MPDKQLRIWVGQQFDADAEAILRKGTADHELVRPSGLTADNLAAAGNDEACRNSDIAFGQPAVEDLLQSEQLRWVALSSAGYTRFDTDPIRQRLGDRNVPLTNASGVYNTPCAQHTLAMMLAACRGLPQAADAQARHEWNYAPIRSAARLLDGTVAIFGFGAIAEQLVALLQPFGCEIVGVRRKPRGDEAVPILSSTDDGAVSDLLKRADHVVNVLPAHPATAHFFDADRFGQLKPTAFYYAIGRGTTTETAALIAALTAGRLAGAWLDVTDPEPLPTDHPLWDTPRCHITPHVAGGLQEEHSVLVRHFLDNLQRFTDGIPLRDRVF